MVEDIPPNTLAAGSCVADQSPAEPKQPRSVEPKKLEEVKLKEPKPRFKAVKVSI